MGRAFAPNSDSGVARANSREATPYRRRRLTGARLWSRERPFRVSAWCADHGCVAAVQHELLRGSGAEFAKPVSFSDETAVRIEEESSAVVVGSGVQLGQVFKARCGIRLPGTAIVAEPGIGPVSRLHQIALAGRIQVLLSMEEER